MRRRQSLPKVWLMTDPRIGDLYAAILRLPKRSGIIFRHYEMSTRDRRALFKRVRAAARARCHVVLLADRPLTARQWGADGAHSRSLTRSLGIRTAAVHNAREAALAKRIGADLIFVSPVFATRSHPGRPTLGARGVGRIAGFQRGITIALGGMTALRSPALRALNIHGWAAIDAFRT